MILSAPFFITALVVGAVCARAPQGEKPVREPSREPLQADAGETQRQVPAQLERVAMPGLRPLTRVGRLLLAGQPTEAALAALVGDGVERVVDLRTAAEKRGFDEPARVAELGAEYVSAAFGGSMPLTDAILDGVRESLAPYRGEGKGRLLLHCASANRVGAAWLAARVLDEGVPYEVALEEAHRVGLGAPTYEEYVRQYILGAGKQELGAWKEKIRKKFRSVKGISVTELARRLDPKAAQEEQRTSPFLLDVREAAEYSVSHIQGALLASSLADARALLAAGPKDREIVVYCSIGYRSGGMAKDLAGIGYTHVRNLEGSIFEWANTGHPVFRGAVRVREVHPFDEEWGRLLNRDLWAKGAKR